MSLTCFAVYFLVAISLPIIVLLWVTETDKQRARRLHKAGNSYAVIARRLGRSKSTIGNWVRQKRK